MIVSVDQLSAFCLEALRKAGASTEDARITTEILVTTDTWGTFTHGTKALRAYIRRVRGGGLKSPGQPRIIREGPAFALIDGGSSIAMVSSTYAMQVAMQKARACGIGFAGLRNNCHYGAAGYYAQMAVAENMIGFSMANDIPTVGGPGAKGPVLGSNPWGFAAPAGDELPIMLDMATSIVAGGKVFAAAALGKPIPDGWIADMEGHSSRDATLFSHAACMVPLAGYKGFCLAFMIEVLAAVLTGSAISKQVLSWTFSEPNVPTGHGAAFMAINIESFLPIADFKARMDHLIREIHNNPPLNDEPRYAPGEIEFRRRQQALAEGIDLPDDVTASLRALADDLHLTFPLA